MRTVEQFLQGLNMFNWNTRKKSDNTAEETLK